MVMQLVGCAEAADIAARAGLQLEGAMLITGCLREVQLTLCHIIANTGEIARSCKEGLHTSD
jgi:hypothetical protein